MRPGWWVEGLRRSRASSQQTGLGGLPQVDQPVEPAHQHVHLLRARAGFGGRLELLTDARHFQIAAEAAKQGRKEMPRIYEELKTAAKGTPSPQQVDALVSGFDRLVHLWQAAKSGLL